MTMTDKMKLHFKPVVRNIKSDDLYFYEGGNVFKNIRTGVSGKVKDEAAKNTFRINLEATQMLNENPCIEKLISALSLRIEIVK